MCNCLHSDGKVMSANATRKGSVSLGMRSEPACRRDELGRVRGNTQLYPWLIFDFTRANNFASDWRVRPGRTSHYTLNLTTSLATCDYSFVKILVLSLRDQLSYFGIFAHRLNENNRGRSQVHSIGRMQLLTALHQHVFRFLASGIRLADDVENVAQHRMMAAVVAQFAEIYGTVRQQHCLIRRIERHSFFVPKTSCERKN